MTTTNRNVTDNNMEHLKLSISYWMQSFACGYKHARHREEIRTVLNIDDRTFRDLCSEIPEIQTSSKSGYWWIKEDVTGEEYRVAREALIEDRSRIIQQWKRYKIKKRAIDDMDNKNKQKVLFV